MILALLITYAAVTFVLWAWRLTADVNVGDAAIVAGITLIGTGIGCLVLGERLHATHAAVAAFGTFYACMLLASLGHPAHMLSYYGRPEIATREQFQRTQWAFVSLFVPSLGGIILLAPHL